MPKWNKMGSPAFTKERAKNVAEATYDGKAPLLDEKEIRFNDVAWRYAWMKTGVACRGCLKKREKKPPEHVTPPKKAWEKRNIFHMLRFNVVAVS